jgi:Protein of unknown function (DUF1579)
MTGLARTSAALAFCLILSFAPLPAQTAQTPDHAGVAEQEWKAIEASCLPKKYSAGPEAYYECVHEGLEALSAAQKLRYFAGTWNLAGEMKASPFGPAGQFTATERNEWLPDRWSLAAHWEEHRPAGARTGAAVYRYDARRKLYTCRETDSAGKIQAATGTLAGTTWTWTSRPRLPSGETARGRFTVKEDSPASYSFKFEIAPPNAAWTTVLEGTATKAN